MRDPLGEGYDAWKLATPPEWDQPEQVYQSDCCGAELEDESVKACPECGEPCEAHERETERYDRDYDGPYDTEQERDDDR